MTRLRIIRPLAAAIAASGGAAAVLAQGAAHHGGHRAAPVQAAQAQTPPSPEQMQSMMQQMGGMMGGARPPAATQDADPHAHGAPGAQGAATPPSTAAFLAANQTMHRDMAIQFTGDADRDFAAAMIPHHQGAIEMARIQIQYGRDPDMRRLAEAVIREQEREMAELRTFLARYQR
jgi:uncharacterized protein (DUF305 family)